MLVYFRYFPVSSPFPIEELELVQHITPCTGENFPILLKIMFGQFFLLDIVENREASYIAISLFATFGRSQTKKTILTDLWIGSNGINVCYAVGVVKMADN